MYVCLHKKMIKEPRPELTRDCFEKADSAPSLCSSNKMMIIVFLRKTDTLTSPYHSGTLCDVGLHRNSNNLVLVDV